MILTKKFFGICFFGVFFSCATASPENTAEMFVELFEKYKKTEFKTIVLSQQGEGADMLIFDINKKTSCF